MLGITVLFFLGLWILIILFAMRIGYKRLKNRWAKPYAGLIGAFLGFMLTMGGWFVYWVGEYVYIQHKVTQLCESEGGITVYVTPEQWRKQIGEEEWDKLYPYKTDAEKQSLDFLSDRTIDGVKNYFSFAVNSKLAVFRTYKSNFKKKSYTRRYEHVVVDIKTNQVIARLTYFITGVGQWMTGGSYKSWINNIQSCSSLRSDFRNTFLQHYSNQQLN